MAAARPVTLKLGFDPKDVKILLNSHAHYDHAGGLAALKRATGAKLYDRKQFARLKSLGCDVYLGSHGGFFGLAEILAGKKKFAGCDEYHAFLAGVERRFCGESGARGMTFPG